MTRAEDSWFSWLVFCTSSLLKILQFEVSRRLSAVLTQPHPTRVILKQTLVGGAVEKTLFGQSTKKLHCVECLQGQPAAETGPVELIVSH